MTGAGFDNLHEALKDTSDSNNDMVNLEIRLYNKNNKIIWKNLKKTLIIWIYKIMIKSWNLKKVKKFKLNLNDSCIFLIIFN